MRAVVQGIDPKSSWDRYLRVEGEASDQRLVRSTINWIRDEFAAAAKREDRHGTARLVRLDVSRIPEPAEPLPSLDEFAHETGIEDYSQAEQIAAFEARFGRASARQSRRGRLIRRQLDALSWLQSLVAEPPRAGDAVASWLNPALAGYLHAADIFTLAQLNERINGIGQGWHSGIAALGAGKAQRIVTWLRSHEATTGLEIGGHVSVRRNKLYAHELSKVVAPATDIRPLEKFIVPAELDGTHGLYRRPQSQCLLKASNDYAAVLAWLASKRGLTPDQVAALKAKRRGRDLSLEGDDRSHGPAWLQTLSHTQRAYRKEAERFLLWAIVHKGRALSSMTNEDCTEYRNFLTDPQPATRWCGSRARERWSPLWRPFEGPLSASAQRHSLTILRNLYGFLVDQNYLMGNPWSAVQAVRAPGPRVNPGRSLTLAQWAFVQGQLAMLAESSANRRLALAVRLLYATGLRLSEVVAATVDDLQWVSYSADAQDNEPLEGWTLRVIGKGQREREVPVPIRVVDELKDYLASRGLNRDPADGGNRGAFLLGKAADAATRAPGLYGAGAWAFDPRVGMAASSLYDQLKAFFTDCAAVLKGQGDSRGAERMARASTHWLRHSHASHAIAGGMPIEIAQQNLGHASLATTTVYVTTESKRRMKAVEKFWRS